ncbi:MAG: Uma2 family endonuclease [Armatimonadota bacterium]
MLVKLLRRRFTVDEYHRMTEMGILSEDDHIELIDGDLLEDETGKPRRFTMDEYYRLAEAGILSEDDRVELVEGQIVEMTPIGSRHADCVNRLNMLLATSLGRRAIVSVQNPVGLGKRTEPQPDLALLRPRSYATAHPGPGDVLLMIEVCDTSIRHDREVTLPLYARAGIPEVWLVDLQENVVEVHRQPSPQGYEHVQRRAGDQRLAPQALPDVSVLVGEIL